MRQVLFLFCLIAVSCQKPKTKTEYLLRNHDHLKQVQKAPNAVRKASDAVVMINDMGTGFFISEDGLLMTNNHVLGAMSLGFFNIVLSTCGKSGCSVKVMHHFQAGSKPEEKTLFALPLMVEADLDVSVYQVYESKEQKTKYRPPHHLKLSEGDNSQLFNSPIHLVGHPGAGLKKWSTGKAVKQDGVWFTSNVFALGGSSGGPFLNDAGEVVGIIHRGPAEDLNMVSKEGFNNFSIGTGIKEIREALKQLEGLSLTGSEAFTGARNERLYAALEEEPDFDFSGSDDGEVAISVADFEYYSSECEKSAETIKTHFENNTLADPMAFEELLSPCRDLLMVQSCKPENSGDICLLDQSSPNWVSVHDELSQSIYDFYKDQGVLYRGLSRLSLSRDPQTASSQAKDGVFEFLKKNPISLDFELAKELILFNNHDFAMSYQSQNIADYVMDYKKVEGYQYALPQIFMAKLLLFAQGYYEHKYGEAEQKTKTVSDLSELQRDIKMTLPLGIQVEATAYRIDHDLVKVNKEATAMSLMHKDLRFAFAKPATVGAVQ